MATDGPPATGSATAPATGPPIATGAPAGSDAPAGSIDELRRPLDLPAVGAGDECPVTLTQQRPDPALGFVQGDGRAGPVGLSADGVVEYVGTGTWVDQAWGGQKVLWAVDDTVAGAVLVRGQRLDGPHEVRFDDPAVAELVLAPGLDALPGGWRDYPSFTRLQAPGCYAYQVDTETDSTVIVFRAEGPTVAT